MKKSNFFFLITFLLFTLTNTAWALNPSKEYKQTPEKYNMVYEEEKVTTSDGAVLNAWYFPVKDVKSVQLMLISHGGEGNMGEYLDIVAKFISSGYNVMIYDYRGFGKSSEFAIDNNMYIYPHFQDDLKAVIEHTRNKHFATFNVYGVGIGAGLSLGVGWNRPEVKKIIADTPFLSMEDMEKKFSTAEEKLEVPFAGYDKKHEPIFSLDAAPAKNIQGVMLIVGSNDALFSVKDMKQLQAKQKKLVSSVLVIENPDRISNFKANKDIYSTKMLEFLKG